MLRNIPQPLSIHEYTKNQTYGEQLWTGASFSIFLILSFVLYMYFCAGQNVEKMLDSVEQRLYRLLRPKVEIKEAFEDYGADAVRIGMDLDDPESPVEKFKLGPQVWHPRRLVPIRRHIARTTSAPVFTVPLSPSDEPKKVW